MSDIVDRFLAVNVSPCQPLDPARDRERLGLIEATSKDGEGGLPADCALAARPLMEAQARAAGTPNQTPILTTRIILSP
jgi:hypothetical protein